MKKIIGALAIAAIVGGSTYATAAQAQTTETVSMRQQLTDAQKQILEQIKTLRSEGKDTEAEALAKAHGLDKGFKRRPKPTAEEIKTMTAIKNAIEVGSYSAFTTAIAGTPLAEKVDETTFNELKGVHDLRTQAQNAEKGFIENHKDLIMLVGPGRHQNQKTQN